MSASSRSQSLLVGLVISAVALLVLEGGASVLVFALKARMEIQHELIERAHSSYDPELGWVNNRSLRMPDLYGPGRALTINAQGFRNEREFPREVPAGKARVVALGDSFTLGVGVGDADSWPANLERDCPGVESPNMGQGGYGIDQSYLWYMRDGDAIDHQVLVFAVIADDFERIRSTDFSGYGKPILRLVSGEIVKGNVPVPRVSYEIPHLVRNLHLLSGLRTVELLQLLAGREVRPVWKRNEIEGEEEAGQVAEQIFSRLARARREHGGALVLVVLPNLSSADPTQLAPLPGFARAALEHSAARGIALVDLTPDFLRISEPERHALFIARSESAEAAGHFSAAGNALVAHAVAKRLGELGLVPPDACGESGQ